jgi:DNA-binding response OmpR family regulator
VRILVIEDEKKVAKALREGLEAEHYEVRVAADGEEGFSLASRDSFDFRRGRVDPVLELQHEDLRMDLATRKVARREQSLELTGKEFEILECLLRHRGHIVSREMLARDVWHVSARATPLDNVIDVTMARLRRKIDDPFERKLLHTVRGVGFILGARHE